MTKQIWCNTLYWWARRHWINCLQSATFIFPSHQSHFTRGNGLCIFWAFWRIHTEAYDWNDCWCCSEFFTHGNQHWWYEEKFSLQSTFSYFCSFCWYARSTPESGPSVKHALGVLEWFYMVAKKYYFREEFFFGPCQRLRQTSSVIVYLSTTIYMDFQSKRNFSIHSKLWTTCFVFVYLYLCIL